MAGAPQPLADVAALALWVNKAIDAGDERALLYLESASGLVRTAAGQTWVDDNGALIEAVPVDARTITLKLAARAWVNPAGKTDLGGTGPFRGGAFDADAAGMVLTDEEVDTLALLRPSGTGGLGVISTTRGDLETSAVPGDSWGWPFLEDWT